MSRIRRILHTYFYHSYPRSIQKRFSEWFVDHRNATEKEEALQELWNQPRVAVAPATEQSFRQVASRIASYRHPVRTVSRFAKIGRVAALFLLPLLSASLVYWYTRDNYAPVADNELMECIVPHGEIRAITLPDSSQVLLNAGTVLIYPTRFDGASRTVFLNGEACFTVSRNERQPFIVKTTDMDVHVLGTVFDVSSYADSEQALTTLKSGSVSVQLKNTDSAAILLTPSEQILYNRKSGIAEVRRVNVEHTLAWKDGHLVLQGMSMSEIAKTIERRYGVTIYLHANKYEEERITAKFLHDESIDDFLSVLKQLVPGMKYKTEGQKIYIY
jgi:ferric-dicitrate binding protein FerR (iron transport regulator)